MDTSRYKELFLKEGKVQLETIERILMSSGNNIEDASCIDDLFRCFHSIKGMAASMGYEDMGRYSHALEELLDGVRQGIIKLDREALDILNKGRDDLESMFKAVEEDKPIEVDLNRLRLMVDALIKGVEVDDRDGDPSACGAAQAERHIGPYQTLSEDVKIPQDVKIETRVLDALINLLGELIASRARLAEMAKSNDSYILKEEIYYMEGLLKELSNWFLNIRLIPFKDITFGLERLIKRYSKDKEIELLVEGGEIELDRVVLERILEPLIHIIRNAIDHGIEDREERKAVGKKDKGTIKISLSKYKGEVLIEVTDDGRGMDAERIKKKAISSGFITPEEARTLSEEKALLLTCIPGFTLSESVTEISGRGVGMDVVKATVKGLGGRLKIESEMGLRTKIQLFLPAIAAIIKVLLVSVSKETFALPLFKVKKVSDVGKGAIERDSSGTFILLDDERVPVVYLKNLIGIESSEEGCGDAFFVLYDMGKRLYAIMVEGIIGEMEAYIKDLPFPLSRVKGVSGYTSIKGEKPVFLLDPLSLIQR